ncbi:hypothetical protein COCSUDRAFT_31544 [Coccomyxa subellipsoidea C-169]|uniref:SREBP regulating gene protein n=1 Tax=Coccomyxa subellipsoidea (strain C-169) TaxID=574566 RepID=I0YKS7_COCSC|nr:hypothetical protein COCSUDRAFT_31544 [Coccomyxa subellipsoidea C-169]EIE18996.1 hypothetical protein COCSUDRAFT_31544 [Coccomyxa subellipsoidea C-169]|eukprot:XP_005643540.1 hypothetical protein COCSUDRAFT_31544 [Coccomyxa subellipsoidea C-169]
MQSLDRLLVPCLLVLLAAIKPLGVLGHRSLRIRDIPTTLQTCNNTIQGRWQVADSQGMLCSRQSLRPDNGCCSAGDKYSCATCNMHDSCCADYEHCVSCCQDPQHGLPDLSTVHRAPDRPETGLWPSVFEYCRNKCRTSSKSTVHENAYLSPFHHCFSSSGKPTTAAPPTPPIPKSVTVVLGSAGQSCNALCESTGRRCAQQHLASLNNCNVLREHYACEAGCEPDSGTADAPIYVNASAPKQQRPTICLTMDSKVNQFSCEATSASNHRLCPCIEAS